MEKDIEYQGKEIDETKENVQKIFNLISDMKNFQITSISEINFSRYISTSAVHALHHDKQLRLARSQFNDNSPVITRYRRQDPQVLYELADEYALAGVVATTR